MNSSEISVSEQVWDSLNMIVLIIAILAPLVIAFLVFRYNRIIKSLKKKHENDQKIVVKRIEIYDRLGPKLHDILSFFCYTGNWKEITPIDVIQLKRELDKEMEICSPLFSDELGKKYNGFIQLCFVSFTGWEHEEKIKSLFDMRQEHNVEWSKDWANFFDTNNVIDAIMMKDRYSQLLDYFKSMLAGIRI